MNKQHQPDDEDEFEYQGSSDDVSLTDFDVSEASLGDGSEEAEQRRRAFEQDPFEMDDSYDDSDHPLIKPQPQNDPIGYSQPSVIGMQLGDPSREEVQVADSLLDDLVLGPQKEIKDQLLKRCMPRAKKQPSMVADLIRAFFKVFEHNMQEYFGTSAISLGTIVADARQMNSELVDRVDTNAIDNMMGLYTQYKRRKTPLKWTKERIGTTQAFITAIKDIADRFLVDQAKDIEKCENAWRIPGFRCHQLGRMVFVASSLTDNKGCQNKIVRTVIDLFQPWYPERLESQILALFRSIEKH